MTNVLQPELDINLINLDIKEEPIDIYPEETPELHCLDLDIKEEIKEEIDTYFNINVTDCYEKYASIGQPNTVDLDHFNHDHALLFVKEEPNELSLTETDSDIPINDISPKAPLTQPLCGPTLTSEKIEDITSDINKHISESILTSDGRKSFFAIEKENKDDEESEAKVEDGMIPPIDSESKSSSRAIRESPVRNQKIKSLLKAENDDKKKLSRYQYLELKRLEIDMVVGKRRRSQSINSDEKISSAANQTTSGRNYSKHRAKSIHSDQMPYRRKFLRRSLNNPRPSRRVHNISGSSKLKLEPVLTEAYTPDGSEVSVNESLLQDNTFSCSKCSFTSDKKRTITNHEYYHHNLTNSPIYDCAFCSQKYTRRCLTLHMETMHPQQKYKILDEDVVYKCPESDLSADSNLRLSQHVKSHKSSLTLECPYCEHKSAPKDLDLHINICKMKNTILKCSKIKLEEQIENKHNIHDKYNCEICTFGCDDVELFNLHNLLHDHYKKKIFKSCPYCDIRTSVDSLKEHIYLVHNIRIEAIEKEENVLATVKSTNKCSLSTKLPEEPKSHMESHNYLKVEEEYMFKCKQCSFEIDLLSDFLDHQLTHQPNNEKKTKNTRNVTLSKLGVNMEKNKYTSSQEVLKCQRCFFETDRLLDWVSHQCIDYRRSDQHENATETKINVPDELNVKQNYLIDHDYTKLPLDIEEDPGTLTTQESHLQTQTSYPSRRKCTLCSYTCVTSNQLARHMVAHKLGQPIKKCNFCDFESTQRQLRLHTLIHLKNDNKHCDDYIPTTTEHEKLHKTDDKNEYKYKSCPSISDNQEVENVDCNGMKQLKNLNDGRYRCDKCSFSTRVEHCLYRHQLTHQENQPIRMCSYCSFRSTPTHLGNHVRRIHTCKEKSIEGQELSEPEKEAPRQETGVHKSQTDKAQVKPELSYTDYDKSEEVKCKLWTFAKCSLNMQMVTHKTQKNMKCIQCDFVSTPRLLMNHMKVQHQLGPGAFKFCLIAENESLRNYQKDSSTLTSKPALHIFKCPLCPFTTDLRIKLNCHVKKAHSSVKLTKGTAFQCNFCSWWTSVEATLKKHVNAHFSSNQPIYVCQYCKFKGSKDQVIRCHNYCTMPPKCRTLPPLKVPLHCQNCSFSTHFPADLKRHKQADCQNRESQ